MGRGRAVAREAGARSGWGLEGAAGSCRRAEGRAAGLGQSPAGPGVAGLGLLSAKGGRLRRGPAGSCRGAGGAQSLVCFGGPCAPPAAPPRFEVNFASGNVARRKERVLLL